MAAASQEIKGTQRGDSVFRTIVSAASVGMIALLIGVIILLYIDSRPVIEQYGFSFLITSEWDPVFQNFGAAPYIFGTIVTSIVALLMAVPFAVGAALFISEYTPPNLRNYRESVGAPLWRMR